MNEILHVLLLAFTVPAIAAAGARAMAPDMDTNDLIRTYSTQRIVELNVGETHTFKPTRGGERVIRLVSVREHRDSVIGLVRRADLRVEIDGKPLDLVCMPYTMPTEVAGIRIQADKTLGSGYLDKQVQLSIWDAADPFVDTKRFAFPLREFRFLSQGTQSYNEPVHLGRTDGDPSGNRFYHDYGLDNAGFEGREEVLCAAEGTVVRFWPSRDDVCSVLIEDAKGFVWEYMHLKSFAPEIVIGAHVAIGQKIGMLGRTGPSGEFSHLHVGTYLRIEDFESDNPNRRLNLYPWFVAAYQAQHPKGLLAVARPHHEVKTGETVEFDGSNSLVWGGGKIVEYRWVFPTDSVGAVSNRDVGALSKRDSLASRVFDKPGAYVVELWVKDDQGNEDVDFCQVKIYSKEHTETAMPHIFMTYTPTQEILPNQPVTFRFWYQGEGGGPIDVDFGDGTTVSDYKPFTEIQHAFATPGIHIVAARCTAENKPITQKLKVVVEAETQADDTAVASNPEAGWKCDPALLKPLWLSETMYGESVLFVRQRDDAPVAGSLIFEPTEIMSVKTSAGDIAFIEGRDYTWKPGSRVITVPDGSRIPQRTWRDLRRPAGSQGLNMAHRDGGDDILWSEQGDYAKMQAVVTYKHKVDGWSGPRPMPAVQVLPRTLHRLAAAEPVTIVLLGDSISAGYNASAMLNTPPFQPAWHDLLVMNLKDIYKAPVTLKNLSVGGTDTAWGVTQVGAVVQDAPDLVIIAFGMNDSGGRPAAEYCANVKAMIDGVRAGCPNVEIILVATMMGNKDWTALHPELWPAYRDALTELCGPGIALADTTGVWAEMLKHKQYWDITGNGVNHPNDFCHRIYAQVLSALLMK